MLRKILVVLAVLIPVVGSAQIAGQMDERDPIVAASMVFSSAYALERFEGFCESRHPRTATLVSEARQQWMAEHQELYDQALRVYKELLTAQQINALRSRRQAENDRVVDMINAATPAESFQFCSNVGTTFQAPEAILTDHPLLVATLANFSNDN